MTNPTAEQAEYNPKARKLTADQVRAIRKSTEYGVRLAERYGVSPASISYVRSYRNWKSVE